MRSSSRFARPSDWTEAGARRTCPIAKALEGHRTLAGLYEPRDERFVAKAKDQESHCCYQHWHRAVDLEVIAWLRRFRGATREEFESFLREIYNRPEMRRRFPRGI